MKCISCGFELEEDNKFCPMCGSKQESAAAEPVIAESEMTKVFDASADTAPAAEPVVEEEDENRTVMMDGFGGSLDDGNGFAPQPFNAQEGVTQMYDAPPQFSVPDSYQPPYQEPESYTQPLDGFGPAPYGAQDQAYPYPQVNGTPANGYQDSYSQPYSNQPYVGTEQPAPPQKKQKKQYRKTTVGRRIGSIIMCLLMMLFGSMTMFIGATRMTMKEDNVRKAYSKGTLADLKLAADNGEQTLTEYLMDNTVNAATNEKIKLDEDKVNTVLKDEKINTFAENVLVDFTQFFVFGKTPTVLNGTAIKNFLYSEKEKINSMVTPKELSDNKKKILSDKDIEKLGDRIEGGDLSFLSIDEDGGSFKEKYNIHPKTLSAVFSVWMMAAFGAMTLLCLIMIFVINMGNLPAGLSFNGVTMIIFGALNTLAAAGGLILSYSKEIFLLSYLVRYYSLVIGIISLSVLTLGIIFTIIKIVLKKNTKKA